MGKFKYGSVSVLAETEREVKKFQRKIFGEKSEINPVIFSKNKGYWRIFYKILHVFKINEQQKLIIFNYSQVLFWLQKKFLFYSKQLIEKNV